MSGKGFQEANSANTAEVRADAEAAALFSFFPRVCFACGRKLGWSGRCPCGRPR